MFFCYLNLWDDYLNWAVYLWHCKGTKIDAGVLKFLPKGWETNRGFWAALLHSRCATFGSMFWNHSPQFNIFNCLDPRTNHQNQTSDKQGLCCRTSSLYPKLHPSSSPPFPGNKAKNARPSPAFLCPSPSPRPWRLPWPVAPWIGWIWRDWWTKWPHRCGWWRWMGSRMPPMWGPLCGQMAVKGTTVGHGGRAAGQIWSWINIVTWCYL